MSIQLLWANTNKNLALNRVKSTNDGAHDVWEATIWGKWTASPLAALDKKSLLGTSKWLQIMVWSLLAFLNLLETLLISFKINIRKILRTLSVKLWTTWFQWLCPFFSKAWNIMRSITLRFCLIKLSIWSLYHKYKAFFVTCKCRLFKQGAIWRNKGTMQRWNSGDWVSSKTSSNLFRNMTFFLELFFWWPVL